MSGFSNPIAGASGALTIPQLQSPDYVEGVSGWRIGKDGNAEFNNVRTRGESYVDGPNGSQVALVDGTSNPAITFTPPSVTQQSIPAEIFSFANSPGGANEVCWLVMTSGKENGLADAAIQLFSEAADGSTVPEIIFEFGGVTVAAMTQTGLFRDSFHQATLTGGWAGSGSGVNGLFYSLTLENECEIIADIQNTTATGNSVCFVLPAGYIPVVSSNHPAGWNDPAASNSAIAPWVFVGTNGAVQITGLEAADKPIFFHIFVPLRSL